MNRIRELRQEKKMSLRELAEDINMSFSNIATLERGESQLREDTAQMFADYFNVSLDYLLGNSNDRTNEPKMAFYGGMENLTEQQKKEVLQYIEFIKARDKS